MKLQLLDTFNPKCRNAFIDFPFKLYRNIPQWVPPFRSDMLFLLNREKHPFYRHSNADFFRVESEGDTLGTIAVLRNEIYNQYHHTQTAFFYYFETSNDSQVAELLLNAAEDWARYHDATLLLGPKGFFRINGSGMLIEGFEHRATLGVPYNLPYFPQFLKQASFEKEVDYLSGYLDRSTYFDNRVYTIAERVRQKNNFWIKSFASTKEMRSLIPEINRIHDAAFEGIIDFQFYPSTPEEFNIMADNIIAIADPEIMKLIMHGDEEVGFIIVYPDIAAALQKTRGRLMPFGWITLLWEKSHTKDLSLNGIGILPKYQGLGSNALLYTEVEKVIRAKQYIRAEMIQVQEKNFRSKDDMDSLGVQWVKRHRVFRKAIS